MNIRKIIVIAVVIISSVCVFTLQGYSEDSYETKLEQVYDKAWDGLYDDALKDLNEIIKKDSKCYPAYYSKAGIELLKGEYKQAIKDYKKVSKLAPQYKDDVNFYINIANNAILDSDPGGFINIYNVSLKLDDGYIIKPDKKEKKAIKKLFYIKGFYNAHLTSLEIFCQDSGYTPKKYSDLFKLASKDFMAEIPNLEKQIRKEFFPMITKMEEEMLDSFVEVHKKDFNELKQEILKKENHNLTKKEYCSYFDENAQDLVKYKMNMYKF